MNFRDIPFQLQENPNGTREPLTHSDDATSSSSNLCADADPQSKFTAESFSLIEIRDVDNGL